MSENELVKFANDTIERFKNPFIHHRLSDITLNSVSKFKVRVLPSIKDYIDKFDKTPNCLVFSLAALIVFYKHGSPNDDKEVIDFMKRSSVAEILSNKELWDDNLMYLKELAEKYILLIETDGIKSGLNEALEKGFEE